MKGPQCDVLLPMSWEESNALLHFMRVAKVNWKQRVDGQEEVIEAMRKRLGQVRLQMANDAAEAIMGQGVL